MGTADPQVISPHAPLWGNHGLPHLRSVPDPNVWDRFGILNIEHIMPEGHLLSYNVLKTTFHLTLWMFFRYLQLCHPVSSQFPNIPTVTSHTVELFLTSSNADRILSSLYLKIPARDTGKNTQLFAIRQRNTLNSEDWDEGVQQYIPLVISAQVSS